MGDVVADHADSVARGWLAPGRHGPLHGRHPAFRLLVVCLGVRAQSAFRLGLLTPEARRGPDLPDGHPIQQIGEPQDVVLVGVGQDERRQVGPAIGAVGQPLHEPVDDRGDDSVILAGSIHTIY